MISPAELRQKLLKRYPEFLKKEFRGESTFPCRLRVNLDVDFGSYSQALAQIRALEENAKPRLGYGYTVEYRTVATRKHGTQTRPQALYFETAKDLFTFIGKQEEAEQVLQFVAQTRNAFSLSDQWICANLVLILRYLDAWPEILRTVHELRDLSGAPDLAQLNSRSLPVSLDTKFIERNRTPIQNILDELQIDTFELNRTIYSGEMLVWMRFHRSQHSFYNSRIGIFPVEEFEVMDIPVNQILIIENKACFIQDLPGYIDALLTPNSQTSTLLVWGQGNACLRLKEASWLASKELYYWGDMDLHGLAILGRFRNHFPNTLSLGMDLHTYNYYTDFAVAGEHLERGSWYDYLTKPERELADYLHEYPQKSRIEQERIR